MQKDLYKHRQRGHNVYQVLLLDNPQRPYAQQVSSIHITLITVLFEDTITRDKEQCSIKKKSS